MRYGDKVRFTVAVKSDELKPEDIAVELLITCSISPPPSREPQSHHFSPSGQRNEQGEHLFTLDLAPELCGKLEYRIRAYPYHPALTHRFEMGLMKWI